MNRLGLLLALVSVPALAEPRKTIPVVIPDKGLVEMTDEQYWAYVRPMARLPVMPSEFVFGKNPHPGYHIVHDRYGRPFRQENAVPPPPNAPWLLADPRYRN
jgi:hypothetical protein